MGVFITRGVDADGLALSKKWNFNATVSVGDAVSGGSVIGVVQETETVEHRVMVPPATVARSLASSQANSTSPPRFARWTVELRSP